MEPDCLAPVHVPLQELSENLQGSSSSQEISPVLNLLVVGFHHKKGCQVEYSYPPLCPNSSPDSHECPELWKNLPSLAMPDGSHNFVEDTVYFHLPSVKCPGKTVYGVSSYRQIGAEMLAKKTADITRSTVQKSVCVLSNLPLYGQIQVKMGLITEAYFREGDFTQYSLLKEAYNNLNMCLNPELLNSTQALVGLPLRGLLYRFRHKVVLLFKLILLEKRVLFFHSPVRPLCTSILALLALFPSLVEHGLDTCTQLAKYETRSEDRIGETVTTLSHSDSSSSLSMKLSAWKGKLSGNWVSQSGSDTAENKTADGSFENLQDLANEENEIERKTGRISPSFVSNLPSEDCGFPLQIFTDGYLCHPYLSLSYLDLLSDPKVRGYVIGATNVLFRQKKSLFDVVVELETGKIDVCDGELRRQLELTKEDLRFADHVVRHVIQEHSNNFLDGVGWEGGDDWLRTEFKCYLLHLLRTSLLEDGSKELEEFNPFFLQSWRLTKNYTKWSSSPHPAIMDIQPGHLFSGQLSMSDVKLKLSQLTQTMQSTEKGRKLTNAAASTSRAVAQTGKVVGDVISQAKGALSHWWNAFHNVEPELGEDVLEHDGMRMSDINLDSNNESNFQVKDRD